MAQPSRKMRLFRFLVDRLSAPVASPENSFPCEIPSPEDNVAIHVVENLSNLTLSNMLTAYRNPDFLLTLKLESESHILYSPSLIVDWQDYARNPKGTVEDWQEFARGSYDALLRYPPSLEERLAMRARIAEVVKKRQEEDVEAKRLVMLEKIAEAVEGKIGDEAVAEEKVFNMTLAEKDDRETGEQAVERDPLISLLNEGDDKPCRPTWENFVDHGPTSMLEEVNSSLALTKADGKEAEPQVSKECKTEAQCTEEVDPIKEISLDMMINKCLTLVAKEKTLNLMPTKVDSGEIEKHQDELSMNVDDLAEDGGPNEQPPLKIQLEKHLILMTEEKISDLIPTNAAGGESEAQHLEEVLSQTTLTKANVSRIQCTLDRMTRVGRTVLWVEETLEMPTISLGDRRSQDEECSEGCPLSDRFESCCEGSVEEEHYSPSSVEEADSDPDIYKSRAFEEFIQEIIEDVLSVGSCFGGSIIRSLFFRRMNKNEGGFEVERLALLGDVIAEISSSVRKAEEVNNSKYKIIGGEDAEEQENSILSSSTKVVSGAVEVSQQLALTVGGDEGAELEEKATINSTEEKSDSERTTSQLSISSYIARSISDSVLSFTAEGNTASSSISGYIAKSISESALSSTTAEEARVISSSTKEDDGIKEMILEIEWKTRATKEDHIVICPTREIASEAQCHSLQKTDIAETLAEDNHPEHQDTEESGNQSCNTSTSQAEDSVKGTSDSSNPTKENPFHGHATEDNSTTNKTTEDKRVKDLPTEGKEADSSERLTEETALPDNATQESNQTPTINEEKCAVVLATEEVASEEHPTQDANRNSPTPSAEWMVLHDIDCIGLEPGIHMRFAMAEQARRREGRVGRWIRAVRWWLR